MDARQSRSLQAGEVIRRVKSNIQIRDLCRSGLWIGSFQKHLRVQMAPWHR